MEQHAKPYPQRPGYFATIPSYRHNYFKELFESSLANSIKAIIYRPDREVFQNTLEKEGVRIVSASQTLLGLAGMGYSAMDITKAMVAKYDLL
ncbi:hypothetical protein [Methanohalophilus sp.]